MDLILRLLRAALAAFGAAAVVAVVYAIVDLYLTGHGMGRVPGHGDPWYYTLFSILMFVAAILAAVLAFRQR